MDWFLLTLLCAFALASADAATKAWLSGLTAAELTFVRLSLTGLLLAPLLVGMPDPFALPAPFWGWLALSVPLEIVAMALYSVALRDHPLSLTLPYLAFTPAFVALIGWLLLDERIGAGGLAGVWLVVAGAWLLHLPAGGLRDPGQWLAPLKAMVWAPGARLMLLVALIYSVVGVTGKAAMLYMDPWFFGAFYFVLLGLATLPLVLWRAPLPARGEPPLAHPWRLRGRWSGRRLWQRLWPHRWAILVVAALMAVMILTHFLAVARVETAYMIAVKRLSLVFGILYGAWLFHEPALATRLPAGLLMLAGVAVIVLA